jgi:hypothetical protein
LHVLHDHMVAGDQIVMHQGSQRGQGVAGEGFGPGGWQSRGAGQKILPWDGQAALARIACRLDIGGVSIQVNITVCFSRTGGPTRMQVLLRSNDLIRLNFLVSLLRDAGIAANILDGQMSAVEGSIGAIPRRLVVAADDESRARRVLAEAGEA